MCLFVAAKSYFCLVMEFLIKSREKYWKQLKLEENLGVYFSDVTRLGMYLNSVNQIKIFF